MRRGGLKLTAARNKWEAPSDPIDTEVNRKTITPDTGVLQKRVLVLAQELENGGGPGDLIAAGFIKAQVKNGIYRERANQEFQRDFILWLSGKSPHPGDIKRTQWGTQPMFDDPEIRAYLSAFLKKRREFQLKLEMLKIRPPRGIDQAYLYFKYIVRGHFDQFGVEDTYLYDWDFFVRAFDQSNGGGGGGPDDDDDAPLDPRHPQWPKPYNPTVTDDAVTRSGLPRDPRGRQHDGEDGRIYDPYQPSTGYRIIRNQPAADGVQMVNTPVDENIDVEHARHRTTPQRDVEETNYIPRRRADIPPFNGFVESPGETPIVSRGDQRSPGVSFAEDDTEIPMFDELDASAQDELWARVLNLQMFLQMDGVGEEERARFAREYERIRERLGMGPNDTLPPFMREDAQQGADEAQEVGSPVADDTGKGKEEEGDEPAPADTGKGKEEESDEPAPADMKKDEEKSSAARDIVKPTADKVGGVTKKYGNAAEEVVANFLAASPDADVKEIKAVVKSAFEDLKDQRANVKAAEAFFNKNKALKVIIKKPDGKYRYANKTDTGIKKTGKLKGDTLDEKIQSLRTLGYTENALEWYQVEAGAVPDDIQIATDAIQYADETPITPFEFKKALAEQLANIAGVEDSVDKSASVAEETATDESEILMEQRFADEGEPTVDWDALKEAANNGEDGARDRYVRLERAADELAKACQDGDMFLGVNRRKAGDWTAEELDTFYYQVVQMDDLQKVQEFQTFMWYVNHAKVAGHTTKGEILAYIDKFHPDYDYADIQKNMKKLIVETRKALDEHMTATPKKTVSKSSFTAATPVAMPLKKRK